MNSGNGSNRRIRRWLSWCRKIGSDNVRSPNFSGRMNVSKQCWKGKVKRYDSINNLCHQKNSRFYIFMGKNIHRKIMEFKYLYWIFEEDLDYSVLDLYVCCWGFFLCLASTTCALIRTFKPFISLKMLKILGCSSQQKIKGCISKTEANTGGES